MILRGHAGRFDARDRVNGSDGSPVLHTTPSLEFEKPIPDGRADPEARVRVFVMVLHMVAFDVFGVA